MGLYQINFPIFKKPEVKLCKLLMCSLKNILGYIIKKCWANIMRQATGIQHACKDNNIRISFFDRGSRGHGQRSSCVKLVLKFNMGACC